VTAVDTPIRPAAVLLDGLPPIGLEELDDRAALRVRTDRKYLVAVDLLDRVVGDLGSGARALEIDGRREFTYESTYFDTPTFDSYLGAARSRPDRFKVRLRRYVDTGEVWLEVKTRDRCGHTVKHREPWAPSDAAACAIQGLGATGHRRFLSQFAPIRPHIDTLTPAIITAYRRSTIVLGDARATIDTDLTCHDDSDYLVGIGDTVVVETKSPGAAGRLDRALWSHGVRPARISKFGVGMAALHPELPANKWHRTLGRFVTVEPTG
jgi:VTC domain